MEAKLLTAERFVDMRIGCSYRYVHSTTEYFRPHYHDYYEIFILYDGTALHLINGEEKKLYAGDAVFIRPSDTHDYRCINEKGFDMLNITFTADTAKEPRSIGKMEGSCSDQKGKTRHQHHHPTASVHRQECRTRSRNLG